MRNISTFDRSQRWRFSGGCASAYAIMPRQMNRAPDLCEFIDFLIRFRWQFEYASAGSGGCWLQQCDRFTFTISSLVPNSFITLLLRTFSVFFNLWNCSRCQNAIILPDCNASSEMSISSPVQRVKYRKYWSTYRVRARETRENIDKISAKISSAITVPVFASLVGQTYGVWCVCVCVRAATQTSVRKIKC